MKMEQTECSEMSAYKLQTPWNHPKESTQQSNISPHLTNPHTHTKYIYM